MFKVSIVTFLLAGCRLAGGGAVDSPQGTRTPGVGDATSAVPMVQPQRQAVAIAQAIPVVFSAEHEIVENLNVRLDYFASSKSGGVSIPSCYEEIAGHLVAGRVVCGSKENLQIDVTADRFNQICYTKSPTPKILAKVRLKLPGCVGPSTLQIFKFSPEVRVEAVSP